MATPATPPKGGGNLLTKKLGPLPGWAWAAVALGGYYLWKKRQAATAAAAATTSPTTSTGALSPAPAGAGSYGYFGPGVGAGGGGPVPTGATGATGSPFVAPTGEAQQGSGYGNQGNTVTSASGQVFTNLGTWAAALPLIQAGQTLYFQPAPGVFQPATANGNLISGLGPGTPLYISQGSSA